MNNKLIIWLIVVLVFSQAYVEYLHWDAIQKHAELMQAMAKLIEINTQLIEVQNNALRKK